MTNEEQKLREMVNGISAFTTREELMERLTTLISEGYYPKEFVVWKEARVRTSDRQGKYLYWEDHFTLDELFEYWKENEQ